MVGLTACAEVVGCAGSTCIQSSNICKQRLLLCIKDALRIDEFEAETSCALVAASFNPADLVVLLAFQAPGGVCEMTFICIVDWVNVLGSGPTVW